MKTITITLTVPDGVEVQVQQGVPATVPSSAPQGKHDCPHHGPMEFKKGTSKAGNDYAGWFCNEEGCTTPPQWAPKPR